MAERVGFGPLYIQRFATNRRCHRNSVAGVTMKDRHRSFGNSRLAAARNSRSTVVTGRTVSVPTQDVQFVPQHVRVPTILARTFLQRTPRKMTFAVV
jgi:hypothetical protein